MQAKLKEVKQELRKRMHQPIPEQGRWLGQVVRGYFAYHAVPTNRASISAFRRYVVRLWHRTHASAAQSERPVPVGTDAETGRRLAPSAPPLSSLATRAICRQTLAVRTVCLNRGPYGSARGAVSNHRPYRDPERGQQSRLHRVG